MLLDVPEMASMIRRECEARKICPPGIDYPTFERTMLGFNRRYLEEMLEMLGLIV